MTARLCAICVNDGPGRLEGLDGRLVWVCSRCTDEHPRAGGYAFGQVTEDRMELAPGASRSMASGAKHRSRL